MKKILVVDDAKFMRMMVSNIIVEMGHEVIAEGSNGEEAVELYKKHHPDIVMMDITMPTKDGLQAVKEIIAFDASAKVIMCSAMGQQAMVMDAIKSGAKNFIVKPFQKENIEKAINAL